MIRSTDWKTLALEFLNRDRLFHIDMIESLRRGTGEVAALEPDGVLVHDSCAHTFFHTALSEKTADRLIAHMDRDIPVVAAHQAYAARRIGAELGYGRLMRCHQAMWTRDVPPHAPAAGFALRTLGAEMAEAVVAHYTNADIAYIRDRIAAGEMIGAFAGAELAGFMGLHAEGSMGMLEVLPAFRRRGVATALVGEMCARQLGRGRVPFSQFTRENAPSRGMHEQLGFQISDELMYWLER